MILIIPMVSWNTNFYGALKVSEHGGFEFIVLVTCYPSELNDFVVVLESRMTREHNMPSGMVAKKVRSPSTSVPPSDAPSWAVNSSASTNTLTVLIILEVRLILYACDMRSNSSKLNPYFLLSYW